MLLRIFGLLITAIPVALADVSVTSPAGGQTIPAGPIMVEFQDSKIAPLIKDLSNYNIELMIGGNQPSNIVSVATNPVAVAGQFNQGQTTFSVSFQVSPAAGPPDKNAYFLKITSQPSAALGSGSVMNYSQRFTISGMTGSWPAGSYQTSFQALKGSSTSVPPTLNQVSDTPAAAAAAPPEDAFGISFQFQTGPTRYAPMQLQPGPTITKQDTAPHYPTSAWIVATTFFPIPTIVTTITQNPTDAAVVSRENTASPATMPSPVNDMQKFLARWRDD